MFKYEPAVLYELSINNLYVSSKRLFRDVVEKTSRLFAVRRAVLDIKFLENDNFLHWGWGRENPGDFLNLAVESNTYVQNLGTQDELGVLYLEKEKPFEDFEKRLIDIYLRQIEPALYNIKWANELTRANERFHTIIENAPLLAVHGIDQDGKVSFWNKAAQELYGFKADEAIEQKMLEFFKDPLDYSAFLYLLNRVWNTNQVVQSKEWCLFLPGGEKRTVLSSMFKINEQGSGSQIIRIDVDISERKQMEEQLRYLGFHDPLTGLYNRTFFEHKMHQYEKESSLSIVMCDLDGLKIINDTLGHDVGDNMLVVFSSILRACFRKEDIVARIGGDEFAMLIREKNDVIIKDICKRVKDGVTLYNESNPELPLSISIGFAVKRESHAGINDLFREADNNMYREKLHCNHSYRNGIVKSLAKALEARDFITEGHASRMKDIVVELAELLGLPEHRIADLRLLAQVHDIGKVGIPDHILFKQGPLTADEFRNMSRHCEIGYRIALSAPDLAPIADWVLKHHEWWNGGGYPLGLIGEEIPLECRILAIADAYDAMTSNRPYRKAMTREKAVKELVKCAGTQFDPILVKKFMDLPRSKLTAL